MNKLHVVLLGLGVAFLAYLFWITGAANLWHELTSLGWGLTAIILAEGVADFIHTIGWRHCLSGTHRSISLWSLFRIRMAGFAINYLTPTASLGGEVTKAALLASYRQGPEAVSGVVIGKLCFALAHLVFVVAGSILILWRVPLPRPLWVSMLVSSTALAAGMGGFFLIQKHGKLGALVRWLAARKLAGRVMQRASKNVTEVDEALKIFHREQPDDLLLAMLWHLLGYAVGIFQTWFFFQLINENISLATAAGAWILGLWFDLLTFAVPLNLGTLEGSRIVVFKAIGYDTLRGMTYALSIRLAQLFWAGFGLISYGLLVSKKRLPLDGSASSRREAIGRAN